MTDHYKRFANMRAAKERKRLSRHTPDYPPELPELHKIIVIIDLDFGKKVNVMKLYKTDQFD